MSDVAAGNSCRRSPPTYDPCFLLMKAWAPSDPAGSIHVRVHTGTIAAAHTVA